ncbi:hypothetical protein C8J56DRAFT_818623 [Mycena floridula]|nr:hypothetical protein C8J56DRAFT_818623 [Mycena floridula]
MALASSIYYVLDNTFAGLTYAGGGNWSVFESPYFMNGSITWAAFDVFGPSTGGDPTAGPGTIELTFDGTAVSFYGITTIQASGKANSPNFTVSIDGSAATKASTGDVHPPHYVQWYNSNATVLQEGQHVLKLENINGTGVDYVLVNPGQNTLLTGQRLMVDDTYAGINYTGGWQVDKDTLVTGNGSLYSGTSFKSTSHQSSAVGSSFTFSFSGTELAVYGIYPWNKPGNYEITVKVDNQDPFTVAYKSSDNPTVPVPTQPNFKLFTTGDLAAGDHTVTATLTKCVGQLLIVDYIQYTPSFSSLATMPDLSGGVTFTSSTATPSSTQGPSNTSGGGGSGGATGTTTDAPITTPTSGSKKGPMGSFAHLIIGGAIILATLGLL